LGITSKEEWKIMNITPTQQYWYNTTNGEQVCLAHAGQYLKSGIQAKPKNKSHKTPLGIWKATSAEDIEYFTAEFGSPCESCAFGH
jgi:hypothetical protein